MADLPADGVTSVTVVPRVTVIALCYNHERFLIETLESIRAQTCQDFQLIVTDDASRDDSPAMIEQWLRQHRPDATFIRHAHNAGLCRTLNEALAIARGTFICMVATDDTWQPERLALQLAAFAGQPESVAVVYSDVTQMDEQGAALPLSFIAQHRPGFAAPSGSVFSHLADGNFIPAMAATIRRSALTAVGGYDERLTYEDYDMWLRLSARFDFLYCPGQLARYRIVSTSLVRTLFVRPSANHSYSTALIRQRWLGAGCLTSAQRRRWADYLYDAAYNLYLLDDRRARVVLWQAFRYSLKARMFMLALSYSLGISRARLKQLFGGGAHQ